MLTIELTKEKIKGKKIKIPRYTIKVNGITEPNARFISSIERTHHNESKEVLSVHFIDEKIIQLLTESRFSQVEKFLGGLSFIRTISFFPDIFFEIKIKCLLKDVIYSDPKRTTTIFIKPSNRDKWKKSYSIEEAMDSILAILKPSPF